VQVALHGGHDDGASGLALAAGQKRFHDIQSGFHGHCRDQHFRDEDLARTEVLADHVHGRYEGVVDDRVRVEPCVDGALDEGLDFGMLAADDRALDGFHMVAH